MPAFRHDPARFVLPLRAGANEAVRWSREPVVCGYRRFVHRASATGAERAVPICATPVLVPDLGVIVGSYDGFVRFLDATLQRVFWERRLDGGIYAPLVADPHRSAIVVGTLDGTLASFDLRGNRLWSAVLGAPIYAAPLLLAGGEILVVAAFGGVCIGLDAGTGRAMFRHTLPPPWYARVLGTAAHRDPYASPVATPDGGFILCCAETVLSFAADGAERWRHHVDACVRASPVWSAAEGQVVVGTVDGRCHVLDGTTGAPRGTIELGAKIVASPALSGDVIVFGTADGAVHGICATRCERLWRHGHGAPKDHTSLSVLPDGSVIATRANGNVVARRIGDGGFLWETNQQIGVPDLPPELDTTPIAAADGRMYGGSYTGILYAFRFDRADAA